MLVFSLEIKVCFILDPWCECPSPRYRKTSQETKIGPLTQEGALGFHLNHMMFHLGLFDVLIKFSCFILLFKKKIKKKISFLMSKILLL